MTENRKRVCIIGAGPCGISQLRAFQQLEVSMLKPGEIQPELVCYEKQKDWGGLWNYTWRTGLDEHGEKIHGSMYHHLWSNGPKECIEFPDYSFEEHFGKPIPSYPPRSVLADYIKGRAKKYGLRKYVQFETIVNHVDYNDETDKFTLIIHSCKEDTTFTEVFDYVVVAVGHFSTPNVPAFEGFDSFEGRILHSHDFREAKEFEGKRVLIIGSSDSAEDIASQCYKYGATEIVCSYRTYSMDWDWLEAFSTYPLLTKIVGKTAHFINGKMHDVDAIILCTGYLYSFPFLSNDNLRLETDNLIYPAGLYRGVFWEANPKLMYLGMQNQWYTFTMFDAQAWVTRDYMIGRSKLPPIEDMKENSLEWIEAIDEIECGDDEFQFQSEYIEDLMKGTDCSKFDLGKVNEIFTSFMQEKEESILGYRDASYPSVITGKPSPKHHTPWLEEFNDSLEYFLKSAEQKQSCCKK